jgi:NADPH-dependent curcumin reductase CurA
LGANRKFLPCSAVAIAFANLLLQIYQRATVLGFLVLDYTSDAPKAFEEMAKWVQDSKLNLLKTVCEVPFEEVPDAYRTMFEGKGVGKVMTKLKW